MIPAAMRLLDDRNWYLPRWLAWLPQLQIEGPGQRLQPAAADSGAVLDASEQPALEPTRTGSRDLSQVP
jgi:hypothetical protein